MFFHHANFAKKNNNKVKDLYDLKAGAIKNII